MSKFKGFCADAWDVLVFLAYMKFYIMCFCGFLMSMVLALYVINETGGDIEELGFAIKWAGYMGLFYLGVIMIDKFKKIPKTATIKTTSLEVEE